MSKKSKIVTVEDMNMLLQSIWTTLHEVEAHLNDEVANAKIDLCDTAPERLKRLKDLRKKVRKLTK